jgi:hypothetical protein
MKTLNFRTLFGGKTVGKPALVHGEVRSIQIVPTLPKKDEKNALAFIGLRPGMWVVVDERDVGILTNFYPLGINENPDPQLRIQMVDELGLNLIILFAIPTRVRQAAWKDIPEARRPEKVAADNLGYRT